MPRLGIMGGTFDPPHMAHLIMAERAVYEYNLDEVLFIPSGNPPHKTGINISDAEDRYAMTLLSISSNPHFCISRIEIDRSGLSYSIDTLKEIKEQHGDDAEIYFIIGMDEALNLASWHEAEKLPAVTQFIIAPRSGYSPDSIPDKIPEYFKDSIHFLSMQPIYISSTSLRENVAQSHSIRYLVPDSVNEYIHKHHLYKKDIQE